MWLVVDVAILVVLSLGLQPRYSALGGAAGEDNKVVKSIVTTRENPAR